MIHEFRTENRVDELRLNPLGIIHCNGPIHQSFTRAGAFIFDESAVVYGKARRFHYSGELTFGAHTHTHTQGDYAFPRARGSWLGETKLVFLFLF